MTRQQVKVGDRGLHRNYIHWEECIVTALAPPRRSWGFKERILPHVEIKVERRTWGDKLSKMTLVVEVNRRDLLVGEEANAKRLKLREAELQAGRQGVERLAAAWRAAHYHACHILNPVAATPEEVDRAAAYILANLIETYQSRTNREEEEEDR